MSAQPNYFLVRVSGLSRPDEDAFTELCFDQGAEGVSENLAFSHPDAFYEPVVVETAQFAAEVYFAARPPEDFFAKLGARFPGAAARATEEANKDWLQEWRKGFVPFLFVEPFWVVPTWCPRPPEAREIIRIDPGMAFGTGTHETTRLAATLLAFELAARAGQTPQLSCHVLDVGTGTGLLAMVASRLGASRVVAIDNDPEARRVAAENLAQNGLADRVDVPETQLGELVGELASAFDVVLANIIDGALLLLQEDLSAALKPGGTMIVSGILTEREAGFLELFLPATELRVARRLALGEWAAFLLRR